MPLSLFRSEVSRNEKAHLRVVFSWIALTTLGGIYYFFEGIQFGPEPRIVPYAFGLSLLCGLLGCLPLFLDRDPLNRFVSNPIVVQIGLFVGLLIAFASLALGTLNWVVGPFVTSSFGTKTAGTYVVAEKSSGRPDRRSCNHFVSMRDKHSTWRVKVCLSKEVWSAVQVGDERRGVGHRSVLGRTLEQVDWNAADIPAERARRE